jgi:hypothetical protein
MTVTGQQRRTMQSIANFHTAVEAITSDPKQKKDILRAAGFDVDAECSEDVRDSSED